MHKVLYPGILIPVVLLAVCLTGCTTLENRRDLYFPQRVWGPYTKMLHRGTGKPKPETLKFPAVSGSGKNVVTPQK